MFRTGDGISRVMLRFHGTVLFLVTLSSLAQSTSGFFYGTGPFAILRVQGWGYVGLYQAYLLMFVLGVTLWISSFQTRLWRFNLIGLSAHLPPLTINFVAAPVFAATGMEAISSLSITIHCMFIGLETICASQNLMRARAVG